ncbi:MAG: zinc ribbon domain-containing protein [Dehalococcoidia bacterium]|nr:zinc ribbon domain-containing protein [Dehalococcoidia bacterium]
MPIYEFYCECGQRASFFIRKVGDPLNPVCPSCGGSKLERCISRFAYHKSVKTIHEETGEASMFPRDPSYYKDPRNIGRSTEKRLKELGIDWDSEEYRDTFSGVKETIAAAREGELPKTLKDQL